ncbi:MAG: LysR family transcriptional regulator [Verrucomicrobiota bacterium JB022]|nr:LysR family transcriptional regulator [Verrucomicrobiota bacterium JB022]
MPSLLDSRQLLNFVTLARTGSYTRAAHELNLTQSAISHSIKALETDLGYKLVKRAGQRLLLTEHGEIFHTEAQQIVESMFRLRHKLDELNEWGRGRLRVAASNTACQYLVPSILREFKQSFPHCNVALVPADTPASVEALRHNQVDLAVGIRPVAATDLTFYPLFSDELRLVFSPQHAWARQRSISVEDLAGETILSYARSSLTFSMLEAYLNRAGMRLRPPLEVGSMEAIKEMARIGQGVGVVADWVIEKDVAAGKLISRPLPAPRLKREWGLLTLKGKALNLLEETFLGLAEEAAIALQGKNIIRYDDLPINAQLAAAQ